MPATAPPLQEQLNVSRICQDALAREVARLSSVYQVDGALPQLHEEQRTSIAARLRGARERRQSFWYSLGYRTAFDWACNGTDEFDVLEAVAAGEVLDAMANPGWVNGMQSAPPPLGAAARAWADMHRTALEATAAHPEAPTEDLTAFNHGVRDGAKAVCDAVASDVTGAGRDAAETPERD